MESTLEALDRQARLDPGATALVSSDDGLSYVELHTRAWACAGDLRAHGVRTLALVADNSIDWVVVDLAAQLANVVLVPIPGFFSAQQIRHAIRSSRADAILTDRPLSADAIGIVPSRLGSNGRLTLFRSPITPDGDHLPTTTAKISYTSGTTAEPKGACLAQRAMDLVADSLCSVTAELGLARHLCALPLALLLENIAGVFAPLRAGVEIALPSLAELGWSGAAGIDTAAFLRCVRRYEPDSLILVPQMLSDVVRSLEQGAELPRGLKFVAVGGGHVAPALLERAIALGLPIYQGYGLTESASVVALTPPNQMRRGSVGRPLTHARVRIAASGEIMVSGASFLGYLGQPAQHGGEIATGDLGWLDDDGYLFVTGRKKNVYITSFGRNVSPEWIEAELVACRSILQAAVFGEGRPWSTAVVTVEPGTPHDAVDAEIARVNSSLPDYARVGDWIIVTQAFSVSNGLATSNGRNRRDAIWNRFGNEIDARYGTPVAEHRTA